jgi:putative ATPase
MKEPLANRLRPKTFDEVIGQDKVKRLIQTMILEDHVVSMILYGPTGVGKTTIAMLVASHYPFNHFKFNASTDSKGSLKEIVDACKHYGNVLLIVDEIHRMNKDIQDYLLPYVESGALTLLGLTTENPYVAVNPAIRSRVSIFRLESLSVSQVSTYLQGITLEDNKVIEPEVYEYIALSANGEIRTAINMLELLLIQTTKVPTISLSIAKEIVGKPQLALDKNAGNYYDILSAFHKSIRGSDVNAALHYLSRLIVAGDLESILRRISALVYEDVGLANPSMGPKVAAACDICRHIGFPEAINALGAITIELCLSPKSNSAHLAINQAVADVEKGKTYPVPTHLINNPTYDDKLPYLYAHDFPEHIVTQQYMPKELIGTTYYVPQDHTKIEKAFMDQYLWIQSILHDKKTSKK